MLRCVFSNLTFHVVQLGINPPRHTSSFSSIFNKKISYFSSSCQFPCRSSDRHRKSGSTFRSVGFCPWSIFSRRFHDFCPNNSISCCNFSSLMSFVCTTDTPPVHTHLQTHITDTEMISLHMSWPVTLGLHTVVVGDRITACKCETENYFKAKRFLIYRITICD